MIYSRPEAVPFVDGALETKVRGGKNSSYGASDVMTSHQLLTGAKYMHIYQTSAVILGILDSPCC